MASLARWLAGGYLRLAARPIFTFPTEDGCGDFPDFTRLASFILPGATAAMLPADGRRSLPRASGRVVRRVIIYILSGAGLLSLDGMAVILHTLYYAAIAINIPHASLAAR